MISSDYTSQKRITVYSRRTQREKSLRLWDDACNIRTGRRNNIKPLEELWRYSDWTFDLLKQSTIKTCWFWMSRRSLWEFSM